MTSSFFASHPFVTVAVAFDRHTQPLVELGAALAQRLGKRLCLLHVLDSWDTLKSQQLYAPQWQLWGMLTAGETAARDTAKRQLEDIRAAVTPGLEVKVVVVEGVPADAITRQAAALGTSLLLVGVDHSGSRFVPAGLSTGLSLLESSPVPVMAVDTSVALLKSDGHLRVLLADDLTEHSDAAVEFTAALSDGAGKAWVHHVHVNALSSADLRSALESAAAAARTALPEGEIATVTAAVEREQLRRLEARFAEYREYFEGGGGKYTSEVVPGGVRRELGLLAKDFHPDVLVFGRHQAIHAKPFSFGRMPVRAMLAAKRPVIVVPRIQA